MRVATGRRRACLAAVAVAVCAGAALALDGWHAAGQLRDAERSAARLQGLLAQGDAGQAARELQALRRHTAAARSRTSSPLWTAAAAVPWLGRTPAAVQEGVTTLDEVAQHVLPPLLDTVGTLSSPHLRPAGNRIDLDVLRAPLPRLRTADLRLQRLAGHQPQSGVLPAVAERRARLGDQLERLSRVTSRATAALQLLPAALGGTGPRHYFLAFQNPSESRGTGGLVGAYGILTADNGVLSVPVIGDDRDLEHLPPSRVDPGPDYRGLYGVAPALWANTNLSPHFPFAARAWMDSWEQRTGQRLDGAVATDPVGLSHLLRALGAVRLPDGTEITADNVVRRTSWDAYAEFEGRSAARKDFLVQVVHAVVRHALSGAAAGSDVVAALARAAGDGRLRVFSIRHAEQQALEGTSLAGELPTSPAPFAAVVLNNLAGNKLDYHLRREVTYELAGCGGAAAGRSSVVRVTLTNAVPDGRLPPYASGRLDLPDHEAFEVGSTRLQAALYATRGAALRQLTVDGVPTPATVGAERGHPVFAVPLTLARGQTRVVRFSLIEPRVAGPATVAVQPLITAQRTHVRAGACP